MKTCIVLGKNSDIVKSLWPMLEKDYQVIGWGRKDSFPGGEWDLILIPMGSVAPVGHWWEIDETQLLYCLESNLITPIRLLQRMWANRRKDAAVCFFAGSNPNMIMDGYMPYNVGKMALLKACEQLDHESPDVKFFALNPGIVLSKIHKASDGWHNPKLDVAKMVNQSTPPAKIYQCLQWCLSQPKEVIGGRNICVSDDWGVWLADAMLRNKDTYKLRRDEWFAEAR